MPSRMQGHWASFPESRGAFAYHQLVALSPSRQAPSIHKKGAAGCPDHIRLLQGSPFVGSMDSLAPRSGPFPEDAFDFPTKKRPAIISRSTGLLQVSRDARLRGDLARCRSDPMPCRLSESTPRDKLGTQTPTRLFHGEIGDDRYPDT